MKVKALVSFGGAVSMAQGQVKDLPAGAVLDDLVQAGYVEVLEEAKTEEDETAVGETTGHLDREELDRMKKDELIDLAARMGLSAEGTKTDLVERIAAAEVTVERDAM